MLRYNDVRFKEIVSFLRAATDNKLPVFNASYPIPNEDESRIEFELINFRSTGQIYKDKDKSGSDYKVSTISEYRCQLNIRVIADEVTNNEIVTNIAGAIQTQDYLEEYINGLYVENETMRIMDFPFQKDNIINMFSDILVDCYIGIEYSNNINYFDRIEDIEHKWR